MRGEPEPRGDEDAWDADEPGSSVFPRIGKRVQTRVRSLLSTPFQRRWGGAAGPTCAGSAPGVRTSWSMIVKSLGLGGAESDSGGVWNRIGGRTGSISLMFDRHE